MMKQVLLFACLLITFTTSIFGQSLNDQLMIHYRLNDDASDIGQYQLDGTNYGAVTMNNRFENSDEAMFFDGLDDYIELPSDTSYKPELPLSMAFWVYMEDSSDIDNAFLATDNHPSRYYGIALRTQPDESGRMSISYGDGRGAGPSTRRSGLGSTQMRSKTWYHIVCIVRGAQDMDIYINGKKDLVTYDGSGQALAYSQYPGILGASDRSPSAQRHFKGGLDDFMLWSRDLDSTEVNALYTGLLLDMKCDGDAADDSPNHFNGTVNQLTTTTDRFGQAHGALQFNGTDSYIEFPNHPRLKEMLPLSFSMYVYSEDFGTIDNTFFVTDDHPSAYHGLNIRTGHNGKGVLAISYGDGGGAYPGARRTGFGTIELQDGKWNHIAGVIRGPEDMEFYVDGEEDAVVYDGYGDKMAYSDQPGKIGVLDWSPIAGPRYFSGAIDDFHFWHNSLSKDELLSYYKPGMTSSAHDILGRQEVGPTIRLFPNPASQWIQISNVNPKTQFLEIYDFNGRLMRRLNYESGKAISVTELPAGMYLVKCLGQENVESIMFSKL